MIAIKNIVEANLCTGCGVCVSESPLELKMEWNEEGFIIPIGIGQKNAVRVCPFNPQPEKEIEDEDKLASIFLKSATKKDKNIGKFLNTYAGYSEKYRETSSSGGIATYIFEQLLEQKIVNHLFIVKEVSGTYEYQLFNDVSEIKKISKTRYIPVTLEKLFTRINEVEGKIAVSGLPCFIKAIRLKQYYYPELREKIPFLIGIICGGLKSRFFTDYLAQKSGIEDSYSKQEYRIKDYQLTAGDYSFGAFDSDSHFYQMKMRIVGDMWGSGLFKANACDFCDDVVAELADVSLGDAWIEPYRKDGKGTNVVVTRSPLADQLIRRGVEKNELKIEELSLGKFKQSQEPNFRHRQIGLKYRLQKIKKEEKFIPYKRKRFFVNIPFEFKIVQKQRMLVRQKSLDEWKNNKNAVIFDKKIKCVKQNLTFKTKWYHRIQKLKKKLHLKTI
jgi:coenzyme F420-reducing hydrogenase beta subunit